MTSTMASTSQAVSEWVKIFPKQATENYTSSVTFMKQLTVVAISTITYLKNAFPEDSYMTESFGGIKLRILKKICRDECAQFLSTSLSQAFEAFDKRYLHQLAMCFYEDECKPENLIEYHIFDYTYHGDEVTMKVRSKGRDNVNHTAKFTFENVRERTIHMLRSCVVLMQSCQNALPSTYNVSLRLYYNEDAPWDYQAPGFLSADGEEDHLDGSLAESIRVGCVETTFHKLLARSYIRDTAEASHEAIASQNPPTMPSEDVRRAGSSPGSPARLRCPCNVTAPHDAGSPPALLTCYYCGTRQHAACFGVRDEHAALLSRHCCADCHDAEPARAPTDARLASLSVRKRESLCIFRRALQLCARRETVRAVDWVETFEMSAPNAAKLMKLLHSQKVIDFDGEQHGDTPQKIQAEQLKLVIGRFFQSSEENIVDRLLAETLASQETNSDPISEVLSPLEKVSLQTAASVGRVEPVRTDGADADVVMEDSTLKEYREAILSNDKADELVSVTEVRGQDVRGGSQRAAKRQAANGNTNRLGLRSGVKTKRARANND